jgi:type IV pilus assembly protein PilM
MDVDGLALLNCFAGFNTDKDDSNNEGRVTAILNIGYTYTTLAIMGKNGLPFVRDIGYAGRDIIEQIAEENALSIETVTEILTGGKDKDQATTEIGYGLGTACRKLILDVTDTLRYYTTQEKAAVDKILVCGGFALVDGLVELLDSRLPARAVLWNPFDKVRCNAGPSGKKILTKNGPAMAVAAGLAMRSA